MLSADTNVLVRAVTQDDPQQVARAASMLRSNQIWIAKTVLLETEWVLRSVYGLSKDSILAALRSLAGPQNVQLEDAGVVAQALEWSDKGLDFADALHLASSGEAERFITFDRKLAHRAKNLTSLEVVAP